MNKEQIIHDASDLDELPFYCADFIMDFLIKTGYESISEAEDEEAFTFVLTEGKGLGVYHVRLNCIKEQVGVQSPIAVNDNEQLELF